MIKFIDEKKIFLTNQDLKIQIIEIKTPCELVKIGIVDDFYVDPDAVRELAFTIPPTVNDRITSDLPTGKNSGRINAFYILDSLGPVYNKIIQKIFPEVVFPEFEKTNQNDQIITSFQRATFMINVMTSENLPPRVPHIDNSDYRAFASTIYLNKAEECAGGTAFYSFQGKMISDKNINYVDEKNKIKPTKFLIDDQGDWKKIHLVEMKYNRMIVYQQNVFHSAYIDETMFTKNIYRINQQFFI